MVHSTVCQEKRDYSVLLLVALVSGKIVKLKLIEGNDIFCGFIFEVGNLYIFIYGLFNDAVRSFGNIFQILK
jgi:hypothetical protein